MIAQLPRSLFHSLLPVFIFTCILLMQNAHAAFVPASRSADVYKQVETDHTRTAVLQLALMSNRDIEVLTGRKLTLREKLAILTLRREIKKGERGYYKDLFGNSSDCFTMYLKNGDVLEVKLIQITTSEIKYQRCNKPGDPEIIISKADVFSIKDSNGEAIFSTKTEQWNKGREVRDGETDGLALAAGISGIGAVTFGLLFWPLGLAAGLAAGIMGILAMPRFKNNKSLRGKGWAIAGIVAGALWIALTILVLILIATWEW